MNTVFTNNSLPQQDMMASYFGAKIVDGGVNDTRIVGSVTLIAVLGLAIVGMDWVTRVSLEADCYTELYYVSVTVTKNNQDQAIDVSSI